MIGELKEGWHYVFINPTVRAVNLGLACGLIGGGMLVPLGRCSPTEVLGAGAGGYGLFITALGFGVAIGAVGVVGHAAPAAEGPGVHVRVVAGRRRVPVPRRLRPRASARPRCSSV